MRFCPFCSAENTDEAGGCASCGRRLPPLPPRRRKNGLEQTSPIPETKLESGLGPKTKGLADMGASPAASRRAAPTGEAAPEGIVERRRPTARPEPRGRRRTMPPVPSRSERDRLASMSTGFAPGLASESFALPKRSETGSGPIVSAAHAEPSAPNQISADTSVSGPVGSGSVVSGPVGSGPVSVPPPAPISQAVPGPHVEPVTHMEWPAPATSAGPHVEDWNAPATPAPMQQASTASTPSPPIPIQRAASAATPVAGRASGGATWPPPTRMTPIFEPFKAPEIIPVPTVPEAGLWQATRYTIAFARARWQRRGAIGDLQEQIRRDTGVLDGILGTLGRHARSLGVETKALESENKAIDEAEGRRKTAEHECSEISNRQAEETSKFADSESERLVKLNDAETSLQAAQGELGGLEAQKRSLRDQRKAVDTRQKGYLKAADARESESAKEALGSRREELRHSAESLRRDAAGLDQERQDIERRIDALERPIEQISSRVDALKSDVDAAKRALNDLREGHRHRLAEFEAEQGRKSRELAQAEAEIQRRLVTLGTLVNLNRIERDEFRDLYEQIDTLRASIGARSNEIDKLSAEREAYDRASLIRGASVLGGAFLLFLSLLAVILTIS